MFVTKNGMILARIGARLPISQRIRSALGRQTESLFSYKLEKIIAQIRGKQNRFTGTAPNKKGRASRRRCAAFSFTFGAID
jgi:hypothetical protein